jgi:predicted dehydrogenase
VFAESAGKAGGAETTDDRVFITLRHRNGSVSSISYQAGGDRAFPAERIEVFGGGRVAVVENWDAMELWKGGRATRASGKKDKGHRAEMEAFLAACRSGGPWPIPWEPPPDARPRRCTGRNVAEAAAMACTGTLDSA